MKLPLAYYFAPWTSHGNQNMLKNRFVAPSAETKNGKMAVGIEIQSHEEF